jgi:hypothetical protein
LWYKLRSFCCIIHKSKFIVHCPAYGTEDFTDRYFISIEHHWLRPESSNFFQYWTTLPKIHVRRPHEILLKTAELQLIDFPQMLVLSAVQKWQSAS